MKENGLPSANEMHQVSLKKIKEILNPDAVLYLTLQKYGTSYLIIDSQTNVFVSGRLVATATGQVLWEGQVEKTDSGSGGGGGLAGSLISAVVSQAVNSTTDRAHEVSILASEELFDTEGQGLLDGPYKEKP